jgi:hypothetical protein
VLLRRPDTIGIPETLAERLAETAETEALADQLGDPVGRFWSAHNRMSTAVESADLAEFMRSLDTQAALATQIRQPTLRWLSTQAQSVRLLLGGPLTRLVPSLNKASKSPLNLASPTPCTSMRL